MNKMCYFEGDISVLIRKMKGYNNSVILFSHTKMHSYIITYEAYFQHSI